MKFINIKHPEQAVSFEQAVLTGLGKDQGLFFPDTIQPLKDVNDLLDMGFVPRSQAILQHLLQDQLDAEVLTEIVNAAFDFPCPLERVSENISALELFHGPSLAFKDFGARFMAECLARFNQGRKTTILTATSGDTGAAVAQAFYRQAGIEVVVLYPKGKVTPLQEKLFCTLGENVRTFAVESNFDACQTMVKQAFDDELFVRTLSLNSANSINVARLIAQVSYYFEAAAQAPAGKKLVFSVPSGNFGNVTAALLACKLGLPAHRIIAVTNRNDTVPRFLSSGKWQPNPTIATITNAMDVSLPNNFPRVLELQKRHGLNLQNLLYSSAISDEATRKAIQELYAKDYLTDPHSALAWKGLELAEDEHGIFLCTAHPAKFLETLEETLQIKIELPPAIAAVQNKKVLSETIPPEFAVLRDHLT